MRELLPPEKLASLLATFTPPLDPTDPDWADLCSALDDYDRAARLGLGLDEARTRVDIAAMIIYVRCCGASPHESVATSTRPAR
ncbi:hypothetical protein ThrDRAFT_03899 [Frankia casuarinae]|nr:MULTISPECIES: hypothetical protein [unclassified Frankia]ESZ99690.1 hypothetical protein CcI6DRAFT_04894 [Frankia sp. CcI6]EYT90440.1 hypothetical protein ThrDRAFT_03899 [Frankia casuarinae]KFB03280.1 hypothetical protein ALLO2DRAFT_03962 [Frankia sp. Allo2]OAA19306.1 hypothetical protein AAY23_110928 [Frankia casuarinae]